MEVDDDDLEEPEELQQTEIITADLSQHVLMYTLEGHQRSDSIHLVGSIGKDQVAVIVDTGSSHDFLHPRVADKLNLPLKAIRPFRVYVGNVESLLCSFASPRTALVIQGHVFHVDLHILPVHGPDVILGMAWLRSLHRVTNDYDGGTIEFLRDGELICLHVIPSLPRQVSLRMFVTIL